MQNFVRTGVIFNDTILRSNEFFDMLKSKSFVDFRININNVEVGNSPEFIEIKLKNIMMQYLMIMMKIRECLRNI